MTCHCGGLYKPQHPESLAGQSKAMRPSQIRVCQFVPILQKLASSSWAGPTRLARPASRNAGLAAGWSAGWRAGVRGREFGGYYFLGGQTLAEAETAPPLAGPASGGSRIFALDRANADLLS